MAHAESVIAEIKATLEGRAGVVGYSHDQLEPPGGGRAGVRVYVEDQSVEVPDSIAGQSVHKVIVGKPVNKASVGVKADPQKKHRPIFGGLSISSTGDGTLGYFVNKDGKLCLLSAAHVLGKGDINVIQPGQSDGGKPTDKVAELVEWQMLPDDGVDAACAKLVGTEATLELNELGAVTGTASAKLGEAKKSGQMNPYVTTGKIIDLDATYKAPEGWFKHMIVVEAQGSPFSQGGDSGSLVVQDMKAVGVLKGGSDTHDYVCHIATVLTKLGATLAT